MGKMGTVTKSQIKSLFSKVDKRLSKSIDLYIIGGVSAILGYNVIKETNDVDVDGQIDSEFKAIFDEEVKAMGLDLYLSTKGVFSPPDGYRQRCESEDFPNRKLTVWYLNQYDLAISKIDRGIGKDFEDISRVHKQQPYQYEKLIQIFNDEYINISAIGNPIEKKMNMVDLVERLFGASFVEDAKLKLGFE